MKLLAGNSNRTLSQDIADHLDMPLTRAQVKRFADNELAWVAIESYWRARGDEDQARRAADRRKVLRSGQR